ncbi:MAG: hypothetical protein ABI423_00500 [Burkholderiales bacterium]
MSRPSILLAAALACTALLALPDVFAYKGDGVFTDTSISSEQPRYQLDFGSVSLATSGSRAFRFSGLPEGDVTFGLRLRAPHNDPRAVVRLTLKNEKGEIVFHVSDSLANWLRSDLEGGSFLYRRGMTLYVPVAPRAMKPVRTATGPDGGWGTYATVRAAGSYALEFEVVNADAGASGVPVRLVGFGGDWK